MRRSRTIFGPLALGALLLLGLALAMMGRVETPGSAVAQLSDAKQGPSDVPAPRGRLIVPVAGVSSSGLTDTWGQARAQGRTHEGIDILAPRDTAVLAAADGRIVKFFDSVRGGITIYQFDRSEHFVYYYAHLNARAATLHEGDEVHQGDVIGYVGMTGNAPIAHLHFEIERLTPERHWWHAEALNPYPYLLSGQAPRS